MGTATLLETYEDARLLFEAKGWGLNKVAAELAQLAELARFHLNPTKLSQISRAGANRRIEPEVAAAIEGLPTWPSYERQTEIVTKGLLALHGDPSVDVGPVVAAELPGALKEALERKARLPRLSRAARRRITIAGSGAAVGCFAVLVALLAGATRPGPLMVVFPDKVQPDGSPSLLDPRVLLDMPEVSPVAPVAWGEKPLDQSIPSGPFPGQKTPPCDASYRQEEINGGCWVPIGGGKPPCGKYFRRGDQCYAPVSAPKKQ
jgi:hypothetical protein